MRTILLVILSFGYSYITYSQSYEILDPRIDSDDFSNNLSFILRINRNELNPILNKSDSVFYYINGSLNFSYSLRELDRFEERMKSNELIFLSRIDSIYNMENNYYDYYFINEDKSKDLVERKYFETPKRISKRIEFGASDSLNFISNYLYDTKNRLIEERIFSLATKFEYELKKEWESDYLIREILLVKDYIVIRKISVDYNSSGHINTYSYTNKVFANNINNSFNYKIKYNSQNLMEVINGLYNGLSFEIRFTYNGNEILIAKNNNGEITNVKLKFK